MKALTQPEVVDLMQSIGVNSKNARIFSAIAMCEAPVVIDEVPHSNFDALGDIELEDETWGPSVGGFQIRTLKSQTGTGGFRDLLWLQGHPRHQARAAQYIKRSLGFNAWSTYSSGMYKAYLPDLYPAAPGTYVVLGGDTLSGIASKISNGAWTWQQLAERNNLVAPYTIYIGQILMLPIDGPGA